MAYLDETGVSILWNKIKATFGVSLNLSGNTLQLKNNANTPVVLSSVTLPANGGLSTSEVNSLINTALSSYSNTTQMNSAINTAITGAAKFQGTVSANTTISNAAYKKGWYWVVQTAGTYVGQTCEVGDMIFAVNDKGSSYAAADFAVIQNNITTITNDWLESNLV